MTPAPRLIPQAGPAAWTGADLTHADWMVPVGAEAVAELEAAVAADAAAPALPALGKLLRSLVGRLEHGRGFALLRGLPPDRLEAMGAEAALAAIGREIGTALPQDATGALVGRVLPSGPGGAPRFHADPADAVLLLCLRQPRAGGQVSLVSAPALHNALLRSDRAALAALHAGLPHADPEGGPPRRQPVFRIAAGAFAGRYDRMTLAVSDLTEAEAMALLALDAAAAMPGQALSIALHAGDLLLYNPHLVWKQVGAEEQPGDRRHLLRLWLAMQGGRALPDGARAAGAGGPPTTMVGG